MEDRASEIEQTKTATREDRNVSVQLDDGRFRRLDLLLLFDGRDVMRDEGGTAFPITNETLMGNKGMTLRDYFAIHVLQGMLSAPLCQAGDEARNSPHMAVRDAYFYADAMLKEREEKP